MTIKLNSNRFSSSKVHLGQRASGSMQPGPEFNTLLVQIWGTWLILYSKQEDGGGAISPRRRLRTSKYAETSASRAISTPTMHRSWSQKPSLLLWPFLFRWSHSWFSRLRRVARHWLSRSRIQKSNRRNEVQPLTVASLWSTRFEWK